MLDHARLSQRRGLRLAPQAPATRRIDVPFPNLVRAVRRATGPRLLTALLAVGIIVLASNEVTALAAGCTVKGSLSVVGERLYRVPGQDFYEQASVSWLKGERWFCSEDAARASGWRKASR